MSAFGGHTPGPWRAVSDVENHYCPRGLGAKPPEPCPHDLDSEGSWSLEGPPHTGWVGDHDTSLSRRADAELAAAAPDLLAILAAVAPMLPGGTVRHLTITGDKLTEHQVALLRSLLPEVPDNGS